MQLTRRIIHVQIQVILLINHERITTIRRRTRPTLTKQRLLRRTTIQLTRREQKLNRQTRRRINRARVRSGNVRVSAAEMHDLHATRRVHIRRRTDGTIIMITGMVHEGCAGLVHVI